MTKVQRIWVRLALAAGFVTAAVPAQAYIGPGAGFALVSSFLVVFATIVLAVFSVLTWPFRALWRVLLRRPRSRPWIKRLVISASTGRTPSSQSG